MAGLQLDPWQCWVLDQALGQRADGRWSAFEVGLVVPRQNGKGGVIEALELASLFLHDVPIMHTAHLMQTSKDAFKRIWELIAQTPDLRKRVRQVRRANEEHSIEVRSGALLKFMVRSGRSGRGLSDGDLIILDEAMFLDPEQLAALIPTMSTKPNPQVWYTSSAGLATSEQLRNVRLRGERGDPGLCYLEWSVEPPEPGRALDAADERLWAQANPALGIRISPEYVRSELRILGEQFERERLGVFDDPGTEGRVIGRQRWEALTDVGSSIDGDLVLALDVTPERSFAAIAAAGLNAAGAVHLELVPWRRGMTVQEVPTGLDWVVARCVELDESHEPVEWLVDPAGPAGSLVPDLEAAGLSLRLVTARELVQACGGFYDAVHAEETRLAHLGDPLMAAAVDAARKRPLGDGGWAWGRRNSEANIAPLVAVTLAHFGAGALLGDLADNVW